MSASIWAPGTSVDANSTISHQSFSGSYNQTLFTLTAFSYVPGTSSLMVYISGVAQIPGVDFTETSSTSFTLTTALEAAMTVLAVGVVAVAP